MPGVDWGDSWMRPDSFPELFNTTISSWLLWKDVFWKHNEHFFGESAGGGHLVLLVCQWRRGGLKQSVYNKDLGFLFLNVYQSFSLVLVLITEMSMNRGVLI